MPEMTPAFVDRMVRLGVQVQVLQEIVSILIANADERTRFMIADRLGRQMKAGVETESGILASSVAGEVQKAMIHGFTIAKDYADRGDLDGLG